MSQQNDEGKRAARERLREQRVQDRAARKRGRSLRMAGVVVALLAIAGGVAALAARQGGGDDTADAKPIAVGKRGAPAKLTVYEDFRCPACGQFEQEFRSTIRDLEKRGKLKAEYHLVTIIDDNVGGNGSRKAANAAACARDAGKFREYHDVLYWNQPEEQTDEFASTKTLLKLAGKVDGLDSARFRKCVTDGKHNAWVTKTAEAFEKSGHHATPTVLLDGKSVYGSQTRPLTPQKLRQKVERKA
ncbi:MAG: DsbA family protein [Streptomyces sp.]|uniref:DsbA family protein n=1 Tax=Streptomyces sp. TaxID=1931 RepID=UPI003D6A84ED